MEGVPGVPHITADDGTGHALIDRSSHRKGVLRNFAKFTGRHLCQRLRRDKVAGLRNFIKKESLSQVFSCEFYKISTNTFFTEHL